MARTELPGYTDPCPGKKGTDRVKKTCGRCGGTGNVGYGRVASRDVVVRANIHGACFQCEGRGYYTVLVSTERANARKAIREAIEWEAKQAERDVHIWLAAEAQWKQDVEAWLAEEARVNALTKGFVAEIGEVIRNVTGTVEVAKGIEVPGYAYGTDYKMFLVIKLDNGMAVKTFSSSRSAFEMERGQQVRIVRATVTGHENYQGQDQTVVNRIKVEGIEE